MEAQNSLESETKCMDLVKGHIIERQDDALMELHSYFHAPAATLHVLKATFRLLAKEAAVTRAWHAMLQSINNSFFESLKAYNISTECDDATWKAIRCAYKGAGPLKAAQARWAYELPVSCLASVLMLFIRQVRARPAAGEPQFTARHMLQREHSCRPEKASKPAGWSTPQKRPLALQH